MMEALEKIDMALFVWLNEKHTHTLDIIMYWVSHKFFWIPLYLILLLLSIHFFGKKIWLILVAVVLMITCSDQLSVKLFKNKVKRYRPCHNLELKSTVHVVGNCGGKYGFVSSHAANTFALATFFSLLFRQKMRRLGLVLLTWATLVSYSRIYNGVHYPADVLTGALFGMLTAYAIYKLTTMIHKYG